MEGKTGPSQNNQNVPENVSKRPWFKLLFSKCVWLATVGDIFDGISTKDKIISRMVFISGKILAVKKN